MENKYYILKYKCFDSGFFCHFFYILGGVNYSINHNLKPIVDWTHIFHIYGDDTQPEQNPFEYFFNQKYSLNDLVGNSYIIAPDGFSKDIWPEDHIPYGVQGLKLRDHKDIVTKFNQVFSDNFSIRENILQDINSEISKHKTLGVHYRRSDMVLGHPEHAITNSLDENYNKILKIFEQNKFEKIYLASEENEIISFFKEKLGDKLIYQKECWRTDPTTEWCWYNMRSNDRPHHNYLKGKEVLLDTLNLSVCDSLVCGISNVSYASIIFNNLKYNNIYYFNEL